MQSTGNRPRSLLREPTQIFIIFHFSLDFTHQRKSEERICTGVDRVHVGGRITANYCKSKKPNFKENQIFHGLQTGMCFKKYENKVKKVFKAIKSSNIAHCVVLSRSQISTLSEHLNIMPWPEIFIIGVSEFPER